MIRIVGETIDCVAVSSKRSYSTNFPLTENPISEGGNWINGDLVGLDWFDVRTTPGFAFGTAISAGYDDPTAVIVGPWASNHAVEVTVRNDLVSVADTAEMELRLRTTISAHDLTGYELLIAADPGFTPYVQIMRWNGPSGDFTEVTASKPNVPTTLATGDVLTATAIGTTLRLYQNGLEIANADDATFMTGSPGMGFFGRTTTDMTAFGYTHLRAWEL